MVGKVGMLSDIRRYSVLRGMSMSARSWVDHGENWTVVAPLLYQNKWINPLLIKKQQQRELIK